MYGTKKQAFDTYNELAIQHTEEMAKRCDNIAEIEMELNNLRLKREYLLGEPDTVAAVRLFENHLESSRRAHEWLTSRDDAIRFGTMKMIEKEFGE